jgi:hypothetical protein
MPKTIKPLSDEEREIANTLYTCRVCDWMHVKFNHYTDNGRTLVFYCRLHSAYPVEMDVVEVRRDIEAQKIINAEKARKVALQPTCKHEQAQDTAYPTTSGCTLIHERICPDCDKVLKHWSEDIPPENQKYFAR